MQRGISETDFAKELDSRFKGTFHAAESRRESLEQWAWEIHKVAVDVTYGRLRPSVPVEAGDTATARRRRPRYGLSTLSWGKPMNGAQWRPSNPC
jgi:hypothetical protein